MVNNLSNDYNRYSNNFNESKTIKEDIGEEAGSSLSDDSQRYEIDTDYLIEKAYNGWLGRSLFNGVWSPDPKKTQTMSKELADKLKNSIQMKVNTHSNLSIYDEDFIRKVAIETCEVYNEALMYEAPRYNLNNHDFKILITDIKHLIMQLLRIALHGNMVKLRTDSRRLSIVKQESDNIGGLR